MEKISRERLIEILGEQVNGQVTLTHIEMEANGFNVFMPEPDFMIWTNDHGITIIQEDEVSAVHAPFLFLLGHGASEERFELKYEHQLKLLMEDYESRLIEEVGNVKFAEGEQLHLF